MSNQAVPPFASGLGVCLRLNPLGFKYGEGIKGPNPELRSLDAIRPSLRDPACSGPDPVYAIAMDVARPEHTEELKRRMLLFAALAYAAGTLGDEPVRSQGHVHAVAPHCGWSTPELFEVWEGRVIVYLQEHAADNPGRCFAIEAEVGEQVVVPPGWAHCVINAKPAHGLLLGACCDRQYSFLYDEIRARGGLAWFPVMDANRNLGWKANPRYSASELVRRGARAYPELGLSGSASMYEQFVANPDSLQWISDPARVKPAWEAFRL